MNVLNTRFWKHGASVAPSVGVALVPKVVCPMCWPAYAAASSALGIGFVPLTATYMLPLTVTVLVIALGVLWKGTKRRHESWPLPFVVAVLGAVLMVAGKFALESSLALYIGIGGFTAAAARTAWTAAQAVEGRPCCDRLNAESSYVKE